ncbi:GGDEF domain-containing protein [Aneurinibacillus thermoaerophilus]|uniref:GGDEF domain-containing protein n=1 Tax=Aneurinibacillus thermoaerophilus TaxID=143495 RepID=UPI002E22B348|nr:GGDEF domain-containing protein [Aneurinibacillus thermoaerophilus]MED0763821.1 GGDEF domain-containing protein [Aneurinibacillus thermoaerophilus]
MMTSSVYTISSDKSVSFASELMNQWRVGSLVVMDHDTVVGIITSRDVRSSHPNRIVADAMTPDPIAVSSDVFVWDAWKIMDKHGIERLLVMEKEHLAGLVTRETIRMKLSEFIDPLTGLYRAPYIQSVGEMLLTKKQPFHLLFIDLNNFGQINKHHGHPFGDDVILQFSRNMIAIINSERDYLCRYAGDEFVIISLANESEIGRYIQLLSRPIVIHNVTVSAAVGYVNGQKELGFFSMSFREILSKASLFSTSAKSPTNVS